MFVFYAHFNDENVYITNEYVFLTVYVLYIKSFDIKYLYLEQFHCAILYAVLNYSIAI